MAEHAQRGRDRSERWIEPAQILALRRSIILPSGVARYDVADSEVRIVRLLDVADCPTDHHLADPDWGGIGFGIVHTTAHVGIDREVERADQDLARPGSRDGGFHQAKIGFL